jgi:flagellar basal-body rod protein FlgC
VLTLEWDGKADGGAVMPNGAYTVQVAAVVESAAPPRLQYDPKNPLANADGYVTMPNVDVVAETVNMISASRSYQANVEVINTAKSLMMRTLSIGQ